MSRTFSIGSACESGRTVKRLLKFRTSFSSQILVYDSANVEDTITLDYGEEAYERGYATATGALAFFPLIQDALADLSVWSGPPAIVSRYDRLVEASLTLRTGELCVHEPEEVPVILSVQPGDYRVTFAQQGTDSEEFLEIDLFLDPREIE